MAGQMKPPAILDQHRGMAAQHATNLRRLLAEVEANEAALRQRQADLEDGLAMSPAGTWTEAAERARYLLKLFLDTTQGRDPRRQRLVENLLEVFEWLSRADEHAKN
jgi:hypothetical protein